MFRSRSTHRCVTAFFAVLSLLFSQLALANYVCPGAMDAMAMAEMMAAGEPCDGMDTAQPVLCHQHAASVSQSFQVVKVVTPLPTTVRVLVVPALLDVASTIVWCIAATSEAMPPPDPIFLSTLRLRV